MVNLSTGSIPVLLTVSELTLDIQQCLEERYDWVQVRGEISTFKKAPSGHAYFRLKDDGAVLECVAWKSTVIRWSGLELKDGDEVVAGGRITIYPPRGQYQMVVSAIRLAGVGALQQRFEKLKLKLAQEGLFDPERKKNLPRWLNRVAIITSPSGAAVQDFLRVVRNSHCPVEFTVCPVLVQGLEAAGEIAQMIERVNASNRFDLIILCRGGGSLEDLWAFNEEIVARAIAASQIPIITGIGHEIDFTIADFAADLRAPTPTAAAQVICNLFAEYRGQVYMALDRLSRCIMPQIQKERNRLIHAEKVLRRCHPVNLISLHRQKLDDILFRMMRCMKTSAADRRKFTG